MSTAPISLIDEALQYDSSLSCPQRTKKRLTNLYLPPQRYSRQRLFDHMYNGQTIVFHDYPLQNNVPRNSTRASHNLNLLRSFLPVEEKIFIRYGQERTLQKVSIDHVINRWVRGRSKFGVTDLHFRDTDYFNKVDAHAISYFNLLPHCDESVSFLEMLTLVLSSKGIFSDSHSDDADGSNHCFVGKKLWFAWDRRDGEKHGLQDCTYDDVFDQAHFDLSTFVKMKSAHWFIVSEGQTLFMPGNFTHKVITLESYIGFGSFYVSFPNIINSVKRWLLDYSSDVTPRFLATLQTNVIAYINNRIANSTIAEKKKLGYEYFIRAALNWRRGLNKKQQDKFASFFTPLLMKARKNVKHNQIIEKTKIG